MLNIRSGLMVVVLTGVLAGCASPSRYGPLDSNGGYSEVQVNETTYEVRGTVNYRTLPEYAEEYALIRAADIACRDGYPYFKVLRKQIKETQGTRPVDYMTTSYLTIRLQKDGSDGAYDARLLLKNMDKKYEQLPSKLSCPIR